MEGFLFAIDGSESAMESSSSFPPLSDSDLLQRSGASKYLVSLPSRGIFSSTTATFPTSNPGGIRVYICDHETSPREDQIIQTNPSNILIRALTLRNAKGCTKKRPADKALVGRAAAKKPMINNILSDSRQDGVTASAPNKEYHGFTVEMLRAILKEKGLSLRGKKDELIARLKEHNQNA